MKKNYYVKNCMTGKVVMVVEGQDGYWETDFSQKKADVHNKEMGYTAGDIEAASVASMFGTWDKFDEMKKTFDEKFN